MLNEDPKDGIVNRTEKGIKNSSTVNFHTQLFQRAEQIKIQKRKQLSFKEKFNQTPPQGSYSFVDVFSNNGRGVFYGFFIDNIRQEFRTPKPLDKLAFKEMGGIELSFQDPGIVTGQRVYRLGFKQPTIKDFDYHNTGLAPIPSFCDLPYKVKLPETFSLIRSFNIDGLFNRFLNSYPLLLLNPEKYIVEIEFKDY